MKTLVDRMWSGRGNAEGVRLFQVGLLGALCRLSINCYLSDGKIITLTLNFWADFYSPEGIFYYLYKSCTFDRVSSYFFIELLSWNILQSLEPETS
jgi:hypothetical protein